MELWQLDVMGGVWLTDGRELKAVTGIDDHSRFCVAAGLVERANARSVCRVFTQALARYGSPEERLTDNGKVFTGRLGPHPAEVLFDRICREQQITHPMHRGPLPDHHRQDRAIPQDPAGRAAHRPPLRPPPPRPTGRGCLGHRLQPPPPPPGHRHGRPGQTLPAADRRGGPGPSRPSPPAAHRRSAEVTRRVSASGLIGVCYQQVSAGRHLAGQIVTVQLHPSVLQVFFAGQLIRTMPRTSTKEVVQLRAHRPHQPRRPKTN